MATPLYDQSLSQKPLELVSELLRKDDSEMNVEDREQVIVTLAPFLGTAIQRKRYATSSSSTADRDRVARL